LAGSEAMFGGARCVADDQFGALFTKASVVPA